MMRLLIAAGLIALCGCDVAPKAVQLPNTSLSTSDEAYQFVVDGVTASVVASRIAENCEAIQVNQAARNRYRETFRSEMSRLAKSNPDEVRALFSRFGTSVPKDQDLEAALASWDLGDGGFTYFFLNTGVAIEVIARGTGAIWRTGVAPTCEDANREFAQGTLAASFMTRVANN